MQRGWFQSASLLPFVALALALPSGARADVFDMDQFAVIRNGATIFDDPFNETATFAGGSGTTFPSGITFPGGAAANYFVKGTITTTTNNNGQAILDTSKGFVVSLPDPFVPLTSNVQGFLETGGAASATGLVPSTSFTVEGLFDLAVPAVQFGTYGIAVSSQTTGTPGRELEARVRETSTGPVLQLEWLNFAGDAAALVGSVPITSADLTNGQLFLELTQQANADITGSFAFGNGNTSDVWSHWYDRQWGRQRPQ